MDAGVGRGPVAGRHESPARIAIPPGSLSHFSTSLSGFVVVVCGGEILILILK